MSVSDALEVTLASDVRYDEDANAALVSLCRVLADQIDEAGDSVSTRLTAAYLSALKDLAKVREGKPVAPTAAPKTEGKDDSGSNALGKLRSVKGGKAS